MIYYSFILFAKSLYLTVCDRAVSSRLFRLHCLVQHDFSYITDCLHPLHAESKQYTIKMLLDSIISFLRERVYTISFAWHTIGAISSQNAIKRHDSFSYFNFFHIREFALLTDSDQWLFYSFNEIAYHISDE